MNNGIFLHLFKSLFQQCFILLLLFFEMEFRSCCPGWSAMARSWLTATSASWVQATLLPQPLSSWDYRHAPPCLASFVFLVEMGFSMLVRLVSNSLPQVICPSWPSKVLRLQAWATMPGWDFVILHSHQQHRVRPYLKKAGEGEDWDWNWKLEIKWFTGVPVSV